MGIEIERKFLVVNDDYKLNAKSAVFYQGYLSSTKEATVRVRIGGDQGFITVKGKSKGITRAEFEYPIPVDDAKTILDTMCGKSIIHKRRYITVYDGFTWEVDEFYDANQGLVIAEIELTSEEQPFAKPHWLGKEVSNDIRYYNSNLIKHPFKEWKDG